MASIICLAPDKLNLQERRLFPEAAAVNYYGKPGVLVIHLTGTREIAIVLEPKPEANGKNEQLPGKDKKAHKPGNRNRPRPASSKR